MPPHCEICANALNQSTRRPIACFSCPLAACKECVRKFLLTNEKPPQCMQCGALFSQGFLVRHLNRSWVQDVYRPHFKAVLLKSELTKVPESMVYAEIEIERRRLAKQNLEFEARIAKLTTQMVRYKNAIRANMHRMQGHEVPGNLMNDLVDGGPLAVDKSKKFVMRCPAPHCNGFLSTAYKCAICASDTCSACLVVLPKEAGAKAAHACVESDRLSAELIKKDTRPCPLCGDRIFKVSGCDQMYCTSIKPGGGVCGTAFSWKTGAIEKGVIHNPHFYELERAMGAAAPRNVGDVQCGGVPNLRDVLRAIDQVRTPEAQSFRVRLQSMHARLCELTQYTVNDLRQRMRALGECHAHRIPFILNEITEAELGEVIFKKSRDLHKTTDVYHILDVLIVSAIDVFRAIVAETPHYSIVAALAADDPAFAPRMLENLTQRLTTLQQVREYCNDQLIGISVTYSCTVQTFDDAFLKRSHKYSVKDARAAEVD